MSFPKTIFIDTSVFDRLAYDFESPKVSAFLDATKEKSFVLLLPDPTEREVKRHIKDRCNDTVGALDDARRKAPFLRKWKEWPDTSSKGHLAFYLETVALEEWNTFLSNFATTRIGYEHVDLRQIMDWYDAELGPFSARKKNEFPDAFAIAAMLAFAKENISPIAVISCDPDFKKACAESADLLFYDSLPSFTESILSEPSKVKSLKALLLSNKDILSDAIEAAFTYLGFYSNEYPNAEIAEIEVEKINLKDIRVVGLGQNEHSVAFVASIDYSAALSFFDYDRDRHVTGFVYDLYQASGVCKIETNGDITSVDNIGLIVLDDRDVLIEESPSHYDYDD